MKSPTFDETVHIAAGYCYWKMNDYRMNPENGNFPQRWGAIPLALDNAIVFNGFTDDVNTECNQWLASYRFLYKSGNDPDSMFLRSRLMMIILGCFLGLTVFFISKELFGYGGALISLFFYCVCPNIVAHSRLVTSDISATLGFLLSVWTLWKLLHKISIFNVLAAAFSVSLLCLSKMSAPLLLPVFLLLFVVRLKARKSIKVEFFEKSFEVFGQAYQTCLVAVASLFVLALAFLAIWAAYGFRYRALNDSFGARQSIEKNWDLLLAKPGFVEKSVEAAKKIKLLPEAYLYGFQFVMKKAQARYAYLNGDRSVSGWWYFFPLAFMMKTPLPVIILFFGLPLFLILLRAKISCDGFSRAFYGMTPFFVLLAVYLFFAMSSNINIGLRHILLTYPCIYIFFGFFAWAFRSASLRAKAFILGMMGWAALESFSIYPDYLAYFNQLAGGPRNGYKRLVDSSLDWGQDLSQLKKWLDANGLVKSNKIYLSYFGTASIDHYLDARKLPSYMGQEGDMAFELEGGVYCISATMRTMIYLRELFPSCDFNLWWPPDDKKFNELRVELNELIGANPERFKVLLESKGRDYWLTRYRLYSILRFMKLCSYLQDKEPCAQAGHSILIYFLDDKDISQAMSRPLDFEENFL